MDSRFLRLDGTNYLTDGLYPLLDVNPVHKIGGTVSGANKRWYSAEIAYVNALELRGLYSGLDMKLKTYPSSSRNVLFQGYDAGAADYETVAQIESHATDPVFQIQQAGNIIPALNDVADLGSATEYWRDLYVYGIILEALFTLSASGLMNLASGALLVPAANVGADFATKLYYDAASDEIRVYDGAAWNVH